MNLHREIVDHLDVLDRAPHGRRGSGERARPHLAFEAELDVVRGELVAVVKGLAGANEEGPGQAVGRELPAFGDAGPDPALLQVEPDQRVVHHRLVDGIARPALEDRIERLRAKRFDGEDKRAFLILRPERRGDGDNQSDSESRGSRDWPEHEFLPNVRFALLVFETRPAAGRLSVAPRKLVNSAELSCAVMQVRQRALTAMP